MATPRAVSTANLKLAAHGGLPGSTVSSLVADLDRETARARALIEVE